MKVAIVHDYLNQMGGAERIVLLMRELFPEAPIYTSIFVPESVDPRLASATVRTSFLQRLPGIRRHHRAYLPLYPLAFESLDLRGFDLVLSCTTAWTKGILTSPETCHVCYVNTPMRFAWRPFDYLEAEPIPALLRPPLALVLHYLRMWDVTTAARVDHFIANSENVRRRIRRAYHRESRAVIHPPVDTRRFRLASSPGRFYLVVSRLRAYKRIDAVVDAFRMLDLPLKVTGDGPDRASLQRRAGPRTEFLGRVDDASLADLMHNCIAVIVPGDEDFGIVPLEANACGRPVIALSRGGALETVIASTTGPASVHPSRGSTLAAHASPPVAGCDREAAPTGVFFHEQSADAIARAVLAFQPGAFDPESLRRHAERFDSSVFKTRLLQCIQSALDDHRRLIGGPLVSIADGDRQAHGTGEAAAL